MSDTLPEGYELAEVSAAKNVVLDLLEDADWPEDFDRIGLADSIVTNLIKAGVLIPEWIVDPFTKQPAQGYIPTSSQMEAWEGRMVTPVRITGR